MNASGSVASATSTSPKLKAVERTSFRRITSRSWSDEDEENMSLDEFSDALKEALSDVSDRESLSQEEMEKKVSRHFSLDYVYQSTM